MIRAFRRIENYRIFQKWTPEAGAPESEQVNLIYGMNGSGKSTLAELLHDFSTGDNAAELRMEIEDSAGQRRTLTNPHDSFAANIHVFNRDYVRRNLRFDEPDNQIVPLLVLGEQAVDAADQIATANVRLADIAVELPATTKTRTAAAKRASAIATACAQSIAADLGHLGGKWAPRSYMAPKVKVAMGTVAGIVARSEQELIADLELAKSDVQEDFKLPEETLFDTSGSVARVATLLKSTVTSVPIDFLQKHPAHAEWVQAGLALHDEQSQCFFCEGPLPEARLLALARHFDASTRALQSALDDELTELRRLRTNAAAAVGALPPEQLLYQQLRKPYAGHIAAIGEELQSFLQALDTLEAALRGKKQQLFEPVSVVAAPATISLGAATSTLQQHNEISASFVETVQLAAKRIEVDRIAAIANSYAEATEEEEVAGREETALSEERQVLEKEVAKLSQQDLDPLPLASELNEDLARLLGRTDLTLDQGITGFTVCRNGTPAQHLSEGERTALSLLYFLKSLHAHAAKISEAVVIIDDPVSSLDSNVVAGVSSHLWARLVAKHQCRQVFLFTHSFELFRMWSNQLDRSAHKASITFTTQELRIRALRDRTNKVIRKPIFNSWPSQDNVKRRLRSEYHYLFWRAGNTLISCKETPDIEQELDAAAVLPNVCRRLLESFLAFRYPEAIGDLRTGLESAVGEIDDSVTRTRMINYLHQYSHNEETFTGRDVARPESLTVLTAVFELIAFRDRPHYDAMCKALSLDAELLLALS